jgi:flavin reductase (DIM6/NTAB) family NADH-FMN oxidoreductase RutF
MMMTTKKMTMTTMITMTIIITTIKEQGNVNGKENNPDIR